MQGEKVLSDTSSMLWEFAIVLAERGDSSEIERLLLDPTFPVTQIARQFLAELIAGKRILRKRPGIKSRLRFMDVLNIRQVCLQLSRLSTPHAPSKGEVVRVLAKHYNVSEGTIRDVLARRKTFSHL